MKSELKTMNQLKHETSKGRKSNKTKLGREWRLFKKNIPLLSLSFPAIIYTFIFSYLPLE